MESITKLENTIEGLMKSLPHLPVNVRKWIAQYAWIINLIGLIACAVIALMAITGLIIAYMAASAVTSYIIAYGLGSYSQSMMLVTIVSILSMVATVILTAMAIKPLKMMNKKGWDLLFIIALVGAAFSVISALVDFNVFSIIPNIIFTAIGLAISMYFLFEIRSYFTKSGKASEERKISEAFKQIR